MTGPRPKHSTAEGKSQEDGLLLFKRALSGQKIVLAHQILSPLPGCQGRGKPACRLPVSHQKAGSSSVDDQGRFPWNPQIT